MRPINWTLLCCAAPVALLCAPTGALAQSAEVTGPPTQGSRAERVGQQNSPDAGAIQTDDVVVTAERREQNLQDVASAIQSFSQDDLDQSGVNNQLRNLAFVVPGLNIANQEGNIEIYIRGVGSSNNTELGDPSAATHINDVYVPRPRGLGGQFYDLERVEVLKGPQGTLRGRNAVAGTINIITKRPVMGEVGGFVSAGFGNYDQRVVEAALNLPVGDTLAVRLAGFSQYHDSYFNNAGLSNNLTPAGEEDVLSFRGSLLWEPSERLTLYVVGDYVKEGGTGYPGANVFAAVASPTTANPQFGGFDTDDLNLRDVVYRGWQGDLDSVTWGVTGKLAYDFGPVSLELMGSYRDVDFNQTNAENDGIAYPGRDLAAVDYDNFSNQFWATVSKSQVYEARLVTPDTGRFLGSAGMFYFKEDQKAALFSLQDKGVFYSGTEFTMPDVDSESFAVYADGTFSVTDAFRVKGGLRYTDEEKSRYGIGGNFALGLGANQPGAPFAGTFFSRFGTPGFQPAFFDRASFDVSDRSEPALLNYMLQGVKRFGTRDSLGSQIQALLAAAPDIRNGRCIDNELTDSTLDAVDNQCNANGTYPYVAGISAPAQQFGSYEDKFLDYRVGFEYDFTPANLFYGTISTGHKSGGFNDTIPDPDNAGQFIAPVYDPESVTAFELGSKNRFTLGGRRATLNLSAFYYDYRDQVFQQIFSFGVNPDGTARGSSLLNLNVAKSRIYGLEVEGSVDLPAGFTISGNLLYVEPEVQQGSIADIREQNFGNAAATPVADLAGNRLPNVSKLNLIGRVQQVIDAGFGRFDWQVLANYRSDYFLSVYNEQTITRQDGTTADAVALGFGDRVDGFVTLNLGVGFTAPGDRWRIEGFVANLLNEDASTKAIFAPGLNLRFLNDPRTAGVRLRVNF
ncbi:MAG TPA: TonB-dependent receptor [Sphingomonas sp.]